MRRFQYGIVIALVLWAIVTSASVVPAVGLYWQSNFDPTTAGGMAAPLGQLLIRTDTPSIYYKSGTANTAWTPIGIGGVSPTFGAITPAAINATTNNYAPAGLSTASIIRQDVSGGLQDLTGLAAQTDGFEITLSAITTTQANQLRLRHESASSTAANRFFLPSDLDWIIPRDGSVKLRYDLTSSRWRMVASSTNVMPVGTVSNPGLVVGITPTRGWRDSGSTVNFVATALDIIQQSESGFVLNKEFAQSGGQFTANTGASALNLFGTVIMTDAWWLQGSSTPANFTGVTVNDKTYPVHTAVILQNLTAATILTGVTNGTDGRLLVITNISTTLGNNLTFSHEDALSTAANRFNLPSQVPFVLPVGGTAVFRYDGAISRWRIITST